MNLAAYLPSILAVLVAAGDTTDLTLPAIAAGVGVGAIGVSLLVRGGGRDDAPKSRRKKSSSVPPTQSKHGK